MTSPVGTHTVGTTVGDGDIMTVGVTDAAVVGVSVGAGVSVGDKVAVGEDVAVGVRVGL